MFLLLYILIVLKNIFIVYRQAWIDVIQHFVGTVVATPADVWATIVVTRVSVIVVWLT